MGKDLDLRREIGERIRKIRSEMKLTKNALAKQMGVTGQFIGVVESGRSTISYDKLKKLCEISGYSADYILFGKNAEILGETKLLLKDFSEEQIREGCEIIRKMANIINSEAI